MHVSLAKFLPVADAELSDADVALLVRALGQATGAQEPAADAREPLLAPASGSFNAAMAARLACWSEA